ncbi:NADPH-dependent oxidoreductase [Rhodobacteraceae bacterium RKSG542]|uniref:NADPH-dependent FMN reductase n=1 Tax=Pseudovibrio flavus TaxID=2529854 RepID=UPI0012BBBA8C|nr:NAD(P)H-dependent oxidoreductase [Pseudovibrio flavus]MTI17912.1 NADPH-dependent oxidoreductase [Pseudovibrio flavus]
MPRILVFSGSARGGSLNGQLAALVAKRLSLAGADTTMINLSDYPLPIYDGDLEENDGIPDNVYKLRALIENHHGVFIASPEYNSSITPLLKNTLDWISRIQLPEEEPLEVYGKGIYAIGGVSPGAYGSIRSLLHLRTVLEMGLGATVLPEMISVNFGLKAFDENGDLAKPPAQARLDKLVNRLMREASYIELQEP